MISFVALATDRHLSHFWFHRKTPEISVRQQSFHSDVYFVILSSLTECTLWFLPGM